MERPRGAKRKIVAVGIIHFNLFNGLLEWLSDEKEASASRQEPFRMTENHLPAKSPQHLDFQVGFAYNSIARMATTRIAGAISSEQNCFRYKVL